MDMASFTLNMISIIVAVMALVITWRDSRRNSRVTLKLLDLGSHFESSIYEPSPFHLLYVRFRNEGVSLHDVKMSIRFKGEGGGTKSFVMTTKTSDYQVNGEFARGMIAEFQLKLTGERETLLEGLKNPRSQNAEFVVSSQGYEASSFSVRRRFDFFTMKWNKLAFWLSKMTENVSESNRQFRPVSWINLPTFMDMDYRLKRFFEQYMITRTRIAKVNQNQE